MSEVVDIWMSFKLDPDKNFDVFAYSTMRYGGKEYDFGMHFPQERLTVNEDVWEFKDLEKWEKTVLAAAIRVVGDKDFNFRYERRHHHSN
jgi:hypothetical protein